MEATLGSFNKPDLVVVIAEDDPEWSDHLCAYFERKLGIWGLASSEQFDWSVQPATSVEDFTRIAAEALQRGQLVYATLDLRMPIEAGPRPIPEDHAGERMIRWCFEQGDRLPAQHQRDLDFCLISGQEKQLAALPRDGDFGELLRRRGVNRAYKRNIKWGSDDTKELDRIFGDLQAFVRRHMDFCTIPGMDDPVFFGDERQLGRVLDLADRISSAPVTGPYAVFSDSAGYDWDWFSLVCALKGVEAVTYDVRHLNRSHKLRFQREVKGPGKAVFIANIAWSNSSLVELAKWIDEIGFFDTIEERGTMAFFQFPFFETQLQVSKRLDDKYGLPMLEAVLSRIYGEPGPQFPTGISSAFKEHPQILEFPSFERLRAHGVVRQCIAFEEARHQQRTGLTATLDAELREVLSELPWLEQQEAAQRPGFSQLRETMWMAYDSHASHAPEDRLTSVDIEDFVESPFVKEAFDGPLGFQVRGARLHRILRHHGEDPQACELTPSPLGASPSAAAPPLPPGVRRLQELFCLLDVFEAIGRLAALEAKDFDDDFRHDEYTALEAVHKALTELFGSPADLASRIEMFRPNAKHRRWYFHYPSVPREERIATAEVVFHWPYTSLPLHPAIDSYLRQNRIAPSIQHDVRDVLRWYPDLVGDHEHIRHELLQFHEEVVRRDAQRVAAGRYVSEEATKPVLVQLAALPDGHDAQNDDRSFLQALNSLVLFDGSLAICENLFRYGGRFLKTSEARRVLNKPDLGLSSRYLIEYCKELQRDLEREDEERVQCEEEKTSIFARWTTTWAAPESKNDEAARILGEISDYIQSKHKHVIEKGFYDLLHDISEGIGGGAGVSIEDMLKFFCLLRNSYGKNAGPSWHGLWNEQGNKLLTLMRRFVAATTGDYRIGMYERNPDRIRIWCRRALRDAPTRLTGEEPLGKLFIFGIERDDEDVERSFVPLFPIHDVVRMRMSDCGLWTWYSRDKWYELTTADQRNGDDPSNSWLPSSEEMNSSEIWRLVNG